MLAQLQGQVKRRNSKYLMFPPIGLILALAAMASVAQKFK
jgi:hypothetical protein